MSEKDSRCSDLNDPSIEDVCDAEYAQKNADKIAFIVAGESVLAGFFYIDVSLTRILILLQVSITAGNVKDIFQFNLHQYRYRAL